MEISATSFNGNDGKSFCPAPDVPVVAGCAARFVTNAAITASKAIPPRMINCGFFIIR
jgi:hypothetical protein